MKNLFGPMLPERIGGLNELAYNLWWSWHFEARELFKVLDRFLWKTTGHNPVKMLQQTTSSRLVAAAEDSAFLKKYDSVMSHFRADMAAARSWFNTKYPHLMHEVMAYFSLEFAIHSSLPLYAGGLGVLAGDFCKEASDLGLPLVGVGFMYPQGYFHQHVSADGWQEEIYRQLNFDEAPMSRVLAADGQPLTVEVPLDARSIHVSVWQVNVGRVKLYLLDSNCGENMAEDCQLSACLYAGDRELRLRQEMVIGMGGVRVLRALGIDPVVWHANEGHTAFMTLERVRELVEKGMNFDEAAKVVRATTVFTTHTPIPAGNDVFGVDLIEKYFHRYWDFLGLTRESFLQLGMVGSDNTAFNMTALGLRMADQNNGVSRLHAAVCRRMWHSLWPDVQEQGVPIKSVTNGIHVPTWVAPQMARLYERYLGYDWEERHDDPALWERVMDIPDDALLAAHRWVKNKLINYVQSRARQRWYQDNVFPVQMLAMGALFDPEALTLGFARRFTKYKRAELILHDIERLKRILLNDLRPVQIIFAGKAHPMDDVGRQMINRVYGAAKDPQFGGRIAFVEDYDMHLARYLVHGVDVWMNTPQPLHEASGTSGQKAALNGVPHLSVLDGWWCEGYNGANGWAIENNVEPFDSPVRDKADADELYDILEEKVIPLFYDRDMNGIPHGWVHMIKETIRSNAALFSARRMAKEYSERMYLPALQFSQFAEVGGVQLSLADNAGPGSDQGTELSAPSPACFRLYGLSRP